MRQKTTWLLVLLTALLGGWVWWDLSRPKAPAAALGPLFRDLPEEPVSRIRIRRPAAQPVRGDAPNAARDETLSFEVREGRWRMTAPLEGWADDKLLQQLAEQPFGAWPVAALEQAVDPGAYGLGETATEVCLGYGGSEACFKIGGDSTYQQGVYVMAKDGGGRIVLLDKEFARLYRLEPEAYRATSK